ncbi:hypothetical protein [Methanoplanus endosymbiosus]|uniref:Uncharacterized protein n=1 Tax=Methanoplanus endosymbiosus TaxID=33865 RepID=A0A9E7TIF3_9EURY|nr:hypothetical protein [Methanoplanus endosymbiosus]UUX92368.1 hypothetical protein L6E24_13680 [Methanoplanus endosymbiosus]
MNQQVVTDCSIAVVSLIALIISLALFPVFIPGGYAVIASIVLFIIVMTAGGFYISGAFPDKN